jgi:hypothetical protein
MAAVKLVASIDESGTHDGSVYTVMAGWVGRADQWEQFETKWRALLARSGLTHIHSVDLRHGKGQFKDKNRWPPPRRIALAQEAQQLALDHSLFSLSVLLKNADYDAHYIGADKNLRKNRAAIDSKYGVCARIFMSVITALIERYAGEDGQATLVLESGHKSGRAPDQILVGMYEVAPDRAKFLNPAINYALKQLCPGVQAADLLAYPVYVAERDGTADVGEIPGFPDSVPIDEVTSYRVPITEVTLGEVKTGQIAIADFRRQFGPHWLELDGFPVGWAVQSLRSIEGFVLCPPRSSGSPQPSVEPDPESSEPDHYVHLESV